MKSLEGKRIVITRAAHQADELADKIKASGGIAVNYPCIDIAPADDLSLLDSALGDIANYDWLLFTSRNTVYMLAERLNMLDIEIDWSGIKVGAVGTKTAKIIHDLLGTHANFIPKNHTGSDLAQTLPFDANQKILLPQSSLADTNIQDILLRRKANITVVEAYKTIIAQGGDDVPQLLQANQIDAISFTSPSIVENFVDRIAPLTAWHIPAFCIGSTTAKSAQDSGFQTVLFPDEHTITSLVELLVKHFDKVKHDQF